MSGEAKDAERFLALVAEKEAKDPALTSLQAGLIVATELGIASDSRTFARLLGIAHALVLRELNILIECGQLQILKQDARTLRTYCAVEAKLVGNGSHR